MEESIEVAYFYPEFTTEAIFNILLEFDQDVAKTLMRQLGQECDKIELTRAIYELDYDLAFLIENVETIFLNSFTMAHDAKLSLINAYKRTKELKNTPKVMELQPLKKKIKSAAIRSKEITKQWCSKITQWDNKLEDINTFAAYKIRSQPNTLNFEDQNEWHSLFHCNGIWACEEVMTELHLEGYKSMALRKKGISADLDMIRYKVVSNKYID